MELLQELLEPNRKFAHPLPGGMVDRVGHGGIHADDAYLANSLDPQWIHTIIVLGHHDDFDGGHVGAHWHQIVSQIIIDIASRSLVKLRLLE
jgi:hypothetical protein